MGTTGDDILDATLACFSPWHQQPKWGDRNPLDTFGRLLAKNVFGRTWLKNLHLLVHPAQIRSERLMRTTVDLAAAFPPGHQRDEPANVDLPVIVAVYAGRER